jgi:lysophospholipase
MILKFLFFYFTVFMVFNLAFSFDTNMLSTLNEVRSEAPNLSNQWQISHSTNVEIYFHYYQIDFTNCTHYTGKFLSSGEELFANIYVPDYPKGIIVLGQGYAYHTGNLGYITSNLLDQNYTAATFDLPGHGLSSGKRGSISDFSNYAIALNDFISIISNKLKGPYYYIGHSTGCAMLLEYLYTYSNVFTKIVLTAPLVHNDKWDLSQLAYSLVGSFLDTVPAAFPEASHDKEYLNFIRNIDPLQVNQLPILWFQSLTVWNKRFEKYPVINNIPILVIQGTEDDVVDYRYNIPLLTGKFPDIKVSYITNARHQLLNESLQYRNEVFKILDLFLAQ